MDTTQEKTRMTLHDAARLLAATTIHDAEVELARAIEHGELHANVKRWTTEQWDGKQLPGNINRLETWIERSEFERWEAKR